jgi:hypothetical protein
MIYTSRVLAMGMATARAMAIPMEEGILEKRRTGMGIIVSRVEVY